MSGRIFEKKDCHYDISYKVLLLGDSGVGKTALIRNLMGENFASHYITTIGKIHLFINT